MKKILAGAVMLLATILAASQAFAVTAKELAEYCESDKKTEQMFCMGMIQGITSTNNAMPRVERLKLFCPTEGKKIGDLEEDFVQYTKDYPKNIHRDAAEYAVMVFIGMYPCNGNNQLR